MDSPTIAYSKATDVSKGDNPRWAIWIEVIKINHVHKFTYLEKGMEM